MLDDAFFELTNLNSVRTSSGRGQPLGACSMCATGWKEEQVSEYASLVAAVLAICFLKDSGRPLFRNSLRARKCSSSCEFSEASRLLSSKMEVTADALRAFFSGPPEAPLEPATQTVSGQKEDTRAARETDEQAQLWYRQWKISPEHRSDCGEISGFLSSVVSSGPRGKSPSPDESSSKRNIWCIFLTKVFQQHWLQQEFWSEL